METLGLVIMGKQGLPQPILKSQGFTLAHKYLTSFFRSPDGMEIWNVFHAEDDKSQGSCGNDRYTMAERVYFNNTGDSPYFEQAMHLSLEQTAPSGEGSDAVLAKDHEPPQN